MKIIRICVTALGYTAACVAVGHVGAKAVAEMIDNLTSRQGMVVFDAALFTYMLFPAKHFTEGGQRWPWESKR